MGREDAFIVRHDSMPGIGESQSDRAIINRMGMQVVIDFWDQLSLGGFTYHVQIGTEDAPVNSTTSIDDALVWMLVDNNTGNTLLPMLCSVSFDFADTAVNSDLMLELDYDKNRYTSGGTAFTPQALVEDNVNTFNGSAYVGTDIVAAAKTAVPGSVELARKSLTEDAVTDPTTGKLAFDPVLYSCKTMPLAAINGTSSMLVHFGAGTADLNGYGILQFAQIPSTQVA